MVIVYFCNIPIGKIGIRGLRNEVVLMSAISSFHRDDLTCTSIWVSSLAGKGGVPLYQLQTAFSDSNLSSAESPAKFYFKPLPQLKYEGIL